MSYTIAVSGPSRTRAKCEVALESARIPILRDDHHAVMNWRSKFPEDRDEWITVECDDVDAVVSAVEGAKWRLRVHYHTPEKPRPSAGHELLDRLANLERQIAELKAERHGIPPIGGGAVESPPFGIQGGALTYGAEQMRRAMFMWAARTGANNPGIVTGGLVSASDLALSAPGGMTAGVGTGEILIPGNEGAAQGPYYGRATSATSLSISASNPSNPRIDTLVATVADSNYTLPSDLSGNQWSPVVVTGTPTSGATLVNLNGAAAVPGSSYVLGYVLVPASASSIITADLLTVAQPFSLGNVVVSGTDAGKPAAAAGNRGMFWFATDSNAFYYSDGATWRTIYGSRGAVSIATSQNTTSSSYTTLTTPDQVTGIVLPTNGLIAVWYQATWNESVAGAARAAIFIGSNQLSIPMFSFASSAQAAATGGLGGSTNTSMGSSTVGLVSQNAGAYTGDVTTGQIIGQITPNNPLYVEVGGSVTALFGSSALPRGVGGPCYVFAAAGTYTVSVQFKTSSGTVTALNRRLWVQALPFS